VTAEIIEVLYACANRGYQTTETGGGRRPAVVVTVFMRVAVTL